MGKCDICDTEYISLTIKIFLEDEWKAVADVEGCPKCFMPRLANAGIKILPETKYPEPDVKEENYEPSTEEVRSKNR